MPKVRVDSLQGSSTSAASASMFEYVPKRARNVYYEVLPPVVPINMPNQPGAMVVHINATDLAHTMTTVMAE